MTKIFNCPSCGAPIDYDGGPDPTIRCNFCHNIVIVPPELRTDSPRDSEPEPADSEFRTLGQLPQWGEIGRLVKEGKKIEAIKLFRQLTGAGLKESKDAIEKLEAGQVLEVANYAMELGPQNLPPADVDRAAQLQMIGNLLKQGQKIEAIKLYREIFGMGLKEAKDAIERLETTVDTPGAFDIHPPQVVSTAGARYTSTNAQSGASGCSPLTIFVFVVGLVALIFGCYVVAVMDEYDTWDISVIFVGTATYTPRAEEELIATRAPTRMPSPTPAPTMAQPSTFTPAFAEMGILVSWSGAGLGELNNATAIGVDGEVTFTWARTKAGACKCSARGASSSSSGGSSRAMPLCGRWPLRVMARCISSPTRTFTNTRALLENYWGRWSIAAGRGFRMWR